MTLSEWPTISILQTLFGLPIKSNFNLNSPINKRNSRVWGGGPQFWMRNHYVMIKWQGSSHFYWSHWAIFYKDCEPKTVHSDLYLHLLKNNSIQLYADEAFILQIFIFNKMELPHTRHDKFLHGYRKQKTFDFV